MLIMMVQLQTEWIKMINTFTLYEFQCGVIVSTEWFRQQKCLHLVNNFLLFLSMLAYKGGIFYVALRFF